MRTYILMDIDMNFTENQINYNKPDETDASEIIISESSPININFNTLSNDSFTHIQVLHSSPTNPVVIYSAMRYGKRYILKGLNQDFRNDPVQNLLLGKEFEIGLSLDHPNIRHTIGFEEVKELGKVIVLEYIDGTSLKEFIETHSLSPYQARHLVKQIASALKYMHSKQIIHKDLKLSNILITHYGLYVKIIDFNLSDSESYTILKCPGGTKNYIAPEVLNGSSVPTNLSDIFSFGVITRELALNAKDNSLLYLSGQMTKEDPSERPQTIEGITFPKPENSDGNLIKKIISSRITTYLCGITCILLIIFIYFTAKLKQL